MSSVPINKICELESLMTEILAHPGWTPDAREILDGLYDVANDLDANEGFITNSMRVKVLLGIADIRKVNAEFDEAQQARINGVILAFKKLFS